MRKIFALIAFLTAPAAFANGLDDALNANALIRAVHDQAVETLVQDPQATRLPLRVTDVDCSVHPREYGQLLTAFCQFEAQAVYGWYADPSMVFVVTGYVLNGDSLNRVLTAADLKITEYKLQTPLRTGLE